MFKDSLNSVEIRSTEGNDEKSSGRVLYMDMSRMTSPIVIFRERSRSRITVGSGIIMIISIPTTPTATMRLVASMLKVLIPGIVPVLSSAIFLLQVVLVGTAHPARFFYVIHFYTATV